MFGPNPEIVFMLISFVAEDDVNAEA